MPRVYQLGEPCDTCGTPAVMGNKGPYCKACYITWKNGQEKGQTVAKPATVYQAAPVRDYNKEARGKIRHGLLCAFITGRSMKSILEDLPTFKLHLLDIENTIMNGVRANSEKDFIKSLEEEGIPVIEVEYPN
jgi:hypothetical protein